MGQWVRGRGYGRGACGERGQTLVLLHLRVTGIEAHRGERQAPRVKISEQATVVTTGSVGDGFAVRLVDASEGGIAFLADSRVQLGDLVRVAFWLEGSIELEARVIRIDLASFGRNRVACELTRVNPADRAAINRLATQPAHDGLAADESHRDPVLGAARAQSLWVPETRSGAYAESWAVSKRWR